MNKVDQLIFDVYGSYPTLSTARYESFYILSSLFKQRSFDKSRILEVGCGSGIYALVLDKLLNKGFYTGIDLEFKRGSKGIKNRIKKIKSRFKIMNAQNLSFKNSSFDLVLSFSSLEHIKDDFKALKEICRVLKKGGSFFLFVPSIFTYPFQLGRHGFHYYTKAEIVSKLKKAGLKIKQIHNVGGLVGYIFTFCLNWIDLLALFPFWLYFKIFEPKKLKGNSRQDTGGGPAKKILSFSTHLYRKTLLGRKIHFSLLKFIKVIDTFFPILPGAYFITVEK